MAARPFVPGVIKVEWFGTTGYYNWAVIHHVQWTGSTPSVAALTAFATTLAGLWGTDMKGNYYSSLVLNTVTLTDISSATGNQGIDTPNTAGTNTAVGAASNAAILVNYPSSIRYRGGHPRTYWPAATYNSMVDDTHWSSSLVTSVNTFMTAIQNAYSTATSGGTNLAGQCAVSYVTGKAPRVTPLVMPISGGAFTTVARVASQRRRIGRK